MFSYYNCKYIGNIVHYIDICIKTNHCSMHVMLYDCLSTAKWPEKRASVYVTVSVLRKDNAYSAFLWQQFLQSWTLDQGIELKLSANAHTTTRNELNKQTNSYDHSQTVFAFFIFCLLLFFSLANIQHVYIKAHWLLSNVFFAFHMFHVDTYNWAGTTNVIIATILNIASKQSLSSLVSQHVGILLICCLLCCWHPNWVSLISSIL